MSSRDPPEYCARLYKAGRPCKAGRRTLGVTDASRGKLERSCMLSCTSCVAVLSSRLVSLNSACKEGVAVTPLAFLADRLQLQHQQWPKASSQAGHWAHFAEATQALQHTCRAGVSGRSRCASCSSRDPGW